MKIIVNPHKLEIIKTPVNEKEINITKCEFEFAPEITNEYVKEAYFTYNGVSYKQIIVNNECDIPYEVLDKKGQVELGVVAFLVENEEEIKRYNPSPAYFDTWLGSLKDAENSEPITPSEMEQYEQALQDGLNDIDDAIESVERIDIDANKESGITTITITRHDGTTKEVKILDGETGATGNGILKIEKSYNLDLVDTYTITYTNGQTTTFQVTNGKDGKDGEDYVITQQDYNNIAEIVETDIAPTISSIQNTANTANNTANTAKSIAEGANQALSYVNYQTMISAFNSLPSTTYKIGQNIMIVTLNVPDLWISSIESTSSTYTYTTDEAFTTELATNGYVQVGYYRLSALETQKVDLTNYVEKEKIKTTTSTTQGDIYDVTYINTMIGDIETLLEAI